MNNIIKDTKDTKDIITLLEKYNEAYRLGSPIISDYEYDKLVEKLRLMDPDADYLHAVEPEKIDTAKEYKHNPPMLSVEKAYSIDDLKKFISRVKKEAEQVDVYDLKWRVTAKLDGLAGKYDGSILSTRGNGWKGQNITNAFDKGVIIEGEEKIGLGEIVIVKSYFDSTLSDYFEHPRNMAVGIINSDSLSNKMARKTLQDKMIRFVLYSTLPNWTGNTKDLLDEIEDIVVKLTEKTDYYLDGMIIEVTNEKVKEYMGATSHHYRWNIALKSKGETAVSTVKEVLWQVGKTGKITPVLLIKPVRLSGATLSRVSAHHAGMIKKNGIGKGSKVEIIRSGEVIPKIEKIIKRADNIEIPDICPECSKIVHWEKDFLVCQNPLCKGRIEQSIEHWFKTIGNTDWFGKKTIQKIVQADFDSIEKIYSMTKKDFISIGFGDVQSINLSKALTISKTKEVEDWRFLAAFGIPDLGAGDSRKLLSNHKISEITTLTADDIRKIHGFGPITSKSIANGISLIKDRIHHILALQFNLEETSLETENNKEDNKEDNKMDSKFSGKSIVFTGKMIFGTRDDMKKDAIKLGAKVQTSVSGKTDFLVCGENVGVKKIEKAEKMKVVIISEKEYLEW